MSINDNSNILVNTDQIDQKSNCNESNIGSESEKDYNYERRMGRQFSINVHPSKDNKFYKVIIPYNFEKKQYTIKRKEIEFYENKNYLLERLGYFCRIPAFNIESKFKPHSMQNISIYLPIIGISVLFLYLAFVSFTIFAFNPVIIYTVFNWGKKGYNFAQIWKFKKLENYKIEEIKKILEKENSSNFCIDNKLKWILGQSGYWIEIQKLLE
jgi:hypothetical protein